jgi:hypothetical protein
MTSTSEGKVHVVDSFDAISKCHVRLTEIGFDNPTQHMFCMIMEDGVDWRVE